MSIVKDQCNLPPLTFMQALAAAIVKVNGVPMLNIIPIEADCSAHGDIDCDENVFDAEAFVVQNAFVVDNCGRLALKMVIPVGSLT